MTVVGIRIEKVDLPGIGIRHDLVTEAGRRISVVSHRDGERDLGVFDADDPDACRDTIQLNDDEASALADVLGASVMLSRLTTLSDETAGLYTEQIALPTDSPVPEPHARRHEGSHAHARVDRRDRARRSGHPVTDTRRNPACRRPRRRGRHPGRTRRSLTPPRQRSRLIRAAHARDHAAPDRSRRAAPRHGSVGGRLANVIGISPVPFYLVLGLAFGKGGIFPLDASEEFFQTGSEIGVILLLALLGLEYTATELFDSLKTSRKSGIVDAS